MADLMNPGGGLTKSKLLLADANPPYVFLGKSFYSNGSKELQIGTFDGWLVADLGTGTSFNVSGYSGYHNFTTSNFIVGIQSVAQTNAGSGGRITYPENGYAFSFNQLTFTTSYNSGSGVLTINRNGGTISGSSGGFNSASKTCDVTFRAYLRYRP